MEFKEKLEKYRNEINTALTGLFNTQKPAILYQPMKYAVNIGGKRIRPVLCGIFYRLLSGGDDKILNPALAVELLHNFTLVHDDIMDNDDLRRGRETVHVKWDLSTGVLSGDGIVSLAYQVLIRDKFKRSSEIVKVFTDGLLEVCEGQGFDKEFETRDDVTEKEYIRMINNKTAALLEVPSVIGALCADADENMVKLASRYGRALGLGFQIQDDLLDIAGDRKLLGKTFGSDVKEGKKTYLHILAARSLKGSDLERFKELSGKKDITETEILEVKDIYEKNGILKKASQKAGNYIKEAESIIDTIPEDFDKKELREFTEYMLYRKY